MPIDAPDLQKGGLRKRAAHELREFLWLALYLWVCFAALLVLKSAILQAHGIAYYPWGFALVKALVSAKFILLGRAVGAERERAGERPIVTIARKTLALLGLLVVLTVAEEIAVATIEGQPIAAAVAGLGGGTAYQMAATVVILLLIFVPYVGFRVIGDALGEGALRRLLFERRPGADPKA